VRQARRQLRHRLEPLRAQAQLLETLAVRDVRENRGHAGRAATLRLEREIELLREYRTRLVADVVTGKLDVREAAARLPEEVAPESAEDDTDPSDETEPVDEEAAV